jgi:hypothetical protein
MTDREFWLIIRRALLLICGAIERKWLPGVAVKGIETINRNN